MEQDESKGLWCCEKDDKEGLELNHGICRRRRTPGDHMVARWDWSEMETALQMPFTHMLSGFMSLTRWITVFVIDHGRNVQRSSKLLPIYNSSFRTMAKNGWSTECPA